MAQATRLDTIANNIANVNTSGFKKDRQVFSEYLSANERPNDVMNIPRIPASVESFYDMQGGDNAYVNPAGTYTNFEQGSLRSTGNPLDLAIEGKGFLEVLTPQGVRWTRSGSLQVDGTGKLVTKDGFPILRDGGGDPAQRLIQLNSSNVMISQSGEVHDGGAMVGKLALVNFADPDELQKQGNSLYGLKQNARGGPVPTGEARVQQGFVEGSNVNVIEEMTDMIAANRVFEATQHTIKAHDQMDDKLVNNVGKV